MMKLAYAAAAIAAITTPLPASAAEVLFDYASADPADSFSFTLDSNPTPVSAGAAGFSFLDVDVSFQSGTEALRVFFFTEATTSNLLIDRFNNPGITTFFDFDGPQLFSGTTADPTFLIGSFDLIDFNNNQAAGTLTISEVNAAVPEPGTWMLMILGFGAIGASLRSRKQNAKLSVSYS